MPSDALGLVPDQTLAGLKFVTGKGGVGKSTITAAIASGLAAKGQRVLAVDALGSGGLRQVFDNTLLSSAQNSARNIDQGSDRDTSASGLSLVEVLELTTADSLTEYVHLKLRVPSALLRPLARFVDLVAMAAPGVREILTMGKICHEVRRGQWDHVVVDGPSTGHIVELLNAPQAIASIAPSGPLGSETEWMSEMLELDSSSVILVALPEQLSSSETAALARRVIEETKVSIGGVVLNRVASSLTGTSLEAVDTLAEGPLRATAVLAVQRHQVGVEQHLELADLGFPMATVGDAIDALPAAIEALGEVEWCTGRRS